MKNLFEINENEKQRILEMHRRASKNFYLINEQEEKEKSRILGLHKKEVNFEKTNTSFLKENYYSEEKNDVDYIFKRLLDEERKLNRNTSNFIFEQEQTKLPQTFQEFVKLETSPQVKAIPAFTEFWSRLYELKNKRKVIKSGGLVSYEKSIRLWLGDTSKESRYVNDIIVQKLNEILTWATTVRNDPERVNKMVNLSKTNVLTFKGAPSTDGTKESAVDNYINLVNLFIKKMKDLNDAQIYLQTTYFDPKSPKAHGTVWNQLTNKESKAGSTNYFEYKGLYDLLPMIDSVDEKTGKQLIQKKSMSSMSDDIKIELLNKIQEKADNAAKIIQTKKGKRGRKIKNATSLGITLGGEVVDFTKEDTQTQQMKQEEVASQPIEIDSPYPSKSMTDPAVRDFFKDDQLIISAQQKAGFATALADAVNGALKIGKIIEVGYAAGSSTSKVRTAYKSTKYSPENNETLVDDRLAEIEKVMNETIDANENLKGIPKVFRKDKRERYPNNPKSPEWGDAERKKYPLEKRQKLVNGKPNPKFDQRVADEYDKIYGPYRGSFGSFYLKVQPGPQIVNQPITVEQVSYSAQGKYNIFAAWWELPEIDIDTRKRTKGSRGGGGGGFSAGPRAGGHECCFCG